MFTRRLEPEVFPRLLPDADALTARLARNAHEPQSLGLLGMYWVAKRDPRRAFELGKRGVELDEGCGACWAVLTYVYLAHGQVVDARTAFGHALAMFDRRQPLPPAVDSLRTLLAKLPRDR